MWIEHQQVPIMRATYVDSAALASKQQNRNHFVGFLVFATKQ